MHCDGKTLFVDRTEFKNVFQGEFDVAFSWLAMTRKTAEAYNETMDNLDVASRTGCDGKTKTYWFAHLEERLHPPEPVLKWLAMTRPTRRAWMAATGWNEDDY